MDDQTAVMIGFGLFFLSEAIGLSKYKANTVVQMLLTIAMRAFPYEIRRIEEEPPKRHGLFRGERPERDDRKDHRLKRDR